jgi:hypothetical protein
MNKSELSGLEAEQKFPLDQNELAALLEQAAEAHHVYESSLGTPDKDWAGWYATFVAEKAGTESPINAEELATMLSNAAADYGKYAYAVKEQGGTPKEWPSRYAEYIIDKLSQ